MYQVEQIATEEDAFRQAIEEATPFRPLMVKIKLLWQCNLACAMCDYWHGGGLMPLTGKLVVGILDELATLGCRKVHFSGGEPALRPDLPDLVAHARSLKLRVTLTTNGTLLTRDLCRRLVKAGLNSASVSLDSPVRSVHDRIRGTPGAFKQTLAGVRELHRAAKERSASLPIRINTVVSRESYDRLAGLPELAQTIGARHLLLLPVDDPSGALLLNKRRLLDYNLRIAPGLAHAALALGLIRQPREAFPFGVSRQELAASRNGLYAHGLYERQPCYAPWTHALIAADGHVAPCCSAPRLVVGNVQQQSFAQIWQGAAYRALREAMRDGHPLPHCAGCDVFLTENQVLHRICLNGCAAGAAGAAR